MEWERGGKKGGEIEGNGEDMGKWSGNGEKWQEMKEVEKNSLQTVEKIFGVARDV